MRLEWLAAVAATALALSGAGTAGEKSLAECVEAGDFIANAARSRDNGMTREDFLARLDEDLAAIRAFPPALRWFAQDDDDERLLKSAARDVFERPLPPERHAGAFLDRCFGHVAAKGIAA